MTLTPEQQSDMMKQDGKAILDFCADSSIINGRFMYAATWVAGTEPEVVAERGYHIVVISMLLFEVLRLRGVEPYCNVPTTRLMMQAVASSALSINNLFTIPVGDSPVVADAKRSLLPVMINAILKPLTPQIADVLTDAWTVQLTNPMNPVTQIVDSAEQIHTILWGLNYAVAGNSSVRALIIDAMTKLQKIADSTDTLLKDLLYGIILPITDLLGLQETDDAAGA